jgi:hypothetical protein
MHQWKGEVHPLVLTDQGIFTPFPVLTFITLITYQYQLSFYSCSVLPWLAWSHLSLHLNLTTPYCWLINILVRDSVVSYFFCSLHQSSFVSVTIVRQIWFWDFPRSCLSLFTFYHFSIFSSPLTFPAFTSASLLHLPVSSLCGLCSRWTYRWVGLKGRVCVSVSHTQFLCTIPGHSVHARVSQLFP